MNSTDLPHDKHGLAMSLGRDGDRFGMKNGRVWDKIGTNFECNRDGFGT